MFKLIFILLLSSGESVIFDPHRYVNSAAECISMAERFNEHPEHIYGVPEDLIVMSAEAMCTPVK